MTNVIQLPKGGDWQMDISEDDTETLNQLRYSIGTLLFHKSETRLKNFIAAMAVPIKVYTFGSKRSSRIEVQIEPFSLAKYFLGDSELTDIFTDSCITEEMMRKAISEWVDTVIARVALKIDPKSKEYCINDEDRKDFEEISEFFIAHRRHREP